MKTVRCIFVLFFWGMFVLVAVGCDEANDDTGANQSSVDDQVVCDDLETCSENYECGPGFECFNLTDSCDDYMCAASEEEACFVQCGPDGCDYIGDSDPGVPICGF